MKRLRLMRPVRGPLILALILQSAASALVLLPPLALIRFATAWLAGDRTPATWIVIAAVAGTIGSALAADLSFIAPSDKLADWRLVLAYEAAASARVLDALPGTLTELAARCDLDERTLRAVLGPARGVGHRRRRRAGTLHHRPSGTGLAR